MEEGGNREESGGKKIQGEREKAEVRLEKQKTIFSCLSSSVLLGSFFVLHSRLEDSLVIRVPVQKLKDLHQALDVPERT